MCLQIPLTTCPLRMDKPPTTGANREFAILPIHTPPSCSAPPPASHPLPPSEAWLLRSGASAPSVASSPSWGARSFLPNPQPVSLTPRPRGKLPLCLTKSIFERPHNSPVTSWGRSAPVPKFLQQLDHLVQVPIQRLLKTMIRCCRKALRRPL